LLVEVSIGLLHDLVEKSLLEVAALVKETFHVHVEMVRVRHLIFARGGLVADFDQHGLLSVEAVGAHLGVLMSSVNRIFGDRDCLIVHLLIGNVDSRIYAFHDHMRVP
jgi:hypothetical protein